MSQPSPRYAAANSRELQPASSSEESGNLTGNHLLSHTAQLSTSNPVSQVQLRVARLDPHADPRYGAFVATQPDALIYHHPRWLQVLEQAYGYQPAILACEDAHGGLHGVLPLFHTRGIISGDRLTSLPHTPVAGPLASDEQARAALVTGAIEWARKNQHTVLQIKTALPQLEAPTERLIRVPWDMIYVLSLPQRPEALRFGDSRNNARIKWAVGKAARAGVEVKEAETESGLRAWYHLYLDTMRWHRIPPRSFRFFSVAWEVLRPNGLMRLLLAIQHEGGRRRLLAGSIFLMSGQTVLYAFNGRDRDALTLRPNDSILWRAIHDAAREGYRQFDFGEVQASNMGLADFKSKWGAEPRPLYRYYYPVAREVDTGVLRSGSSVRQLADTIWGRLPLATTAILGRCMYDYL
ncbi:MAG: GNAT family N-acetyltransferase [Chloroflexota bacterium]|nr:GNAT family N-acetyltransferase [Chloroflexota bacterium]